MFNIIKKLSTSIFQLSWILAIRALSQCRYCVITKYITIRLRHCFGYDAFRYCIFTDGVFKEMFSCIVINKVIITDTYSLHNMLHNTCKCLNIKIYCLANLANKFVVNQIDVFVKLLYLLSVKKVLIIIGTMPTMVLRMIEIVNDNGKFMLTIVCPSGQVNASIAKSFLSLKKGMLSYCVLRGKVGGLAFASAITNSIIASTTCT